MGLHLPPELGHGLGQRRLLGGVIEDERWKIPAHPRHADSMLKACQKAVFNWFYACFHHLGPFLKRFSHVPSRFRFLSSPRRVL